MLGLGRFKVAPVTATVAAGGMIQLRGMGDGQQAQVRGQSTQALRSLYRRLRKEGEDRQMLERALSTRPLETNIKVGLSLLHHHTMLLNIDREARELAFWQLLRRFCLAIARRYFVWRIFCIRLLLRSTAAISDALVYTFFLAICFTLYQMYKVCRIGVTRAEERYETLAIPIKQTFDALEQAQERRKALRHELEKDMLQQR
ncbi:hypothetical protein TraAM80_05575 [Trypanosoma rangeli]|uniref:Transmembrane protein n=1 Tax=Trypanosoma rangeli TaxID=5698 RepID=A0A422NED0_TRYRA|nr:uncharacterized protein TraAM80_05575 [Trypanosoma rangeli]RNF03752.1 hypothetical protein TraAM80_05575 [Trypanosoma rangeli]|eukprot:RNF03752.1 hypothetical protein TraAM80_05575 [Trypanosoma rangeli]